MITYGADDGGNDLRAAAADDRRRPRVTRRNCVRKLVLMLVAIYICFVVGNRENGHIKALNGNHPPAATPQHLTRLLFSRSSDGDDDTSQPEHDEHPHPREQPEKHPEEKDDHQPMEHPSKSGHVPVDTPVSSDGDDTTSPVSPHPPTEGEEEKPEESNPQSPSAEGEASGRVTPSKAEPHVPVVSSTVSSRENHRVVTPGAHPKGDRESEEEKEEEEGYNVTHSDEGVTMTPSKEDCTPPAYDEFPADLFTAKQRAHGAIIIHILVIIYMFYAVAVVCDDYFIASLEECCMRLNLSEDVAGATFMAAGSSAPELFTAILGVLVAKGDVGTGTIVGSAVFNILFVIGLCGIFSGRAVDLTWWPLFRDSTFYSTTVILLIIIIFDSSVTWYESLIMMCIYAVYIVLMKFNNDVHLWVSRRLGIEDDSPAALGILSQGDKKCYSSYVPFNNEIDEYASMPVTAHFNVNIPPDESIRDSRRRLSLYDAALMIMMTRNFRPKTRFRSACLRIILEQQRLRQEPNKMQTQLSLEAPDLPRWRSKSISKSIGLTSDRSWKKLPTIEEGVLSFLKWTVQAPILATLHYTIPDCRKERWKKFFLLTFVMSITWTAVFSYVMVWMVTLVGYTLGIPDSIMGITFLAAGTSVPDAFASLIVARQGLGDMAVSNSVGSNIFDILIGLAFPWFIQTAIVEPGSIAVINSRGMVYSVILLFLTIIITMGGIYLSHWQLTKKLGIILLFVYALFLLISILIEFNMLGYVNPPMCIK